LQTFVGGLRVADERRDIEPGGAVMSRRDWVIFVGIVAIAVAAYLFVSYG